jgi:ER membrane protein complex subunit 1
MIFVTRFSMGSYKYTAYKYAAVTPIPGDLSVRWRDPFGFKQVIVAATKYGKVFGIDSVSGDILWSRLLGGTITPLKIFTTHRVGDIHETPQVIILSQRIVANVRYFPGNSGLYLTAYTFKTPVETVLYHLDARSGEDLTKSSPNNDPLEGLDVFDGPLAEAFFQREHGIVILLDKSLQVRLCEAPI